MIVDANAREALGVSDGSSDHSNAEDPWNVGM